MRSIGGEKAFGRRSSVSRKKMESVPLQRVSVAQCDHTSAGGHRPHSCPGGFGRWYLRSIGGKKPFGRRSSVSRGKMESVPLQRVSVAQCDHTAGGHRRHSWPGGFGRWILRSSAKQNGKRPSSSRGKMESAPLQRVGVTHCDHTTAGGRQTTFLTRRFG